MLHKKCEEQKELMEGGSDEGSTPWDGGKTNWQLLDY